MNRIKQYQEEMERRRKGREELTNQRDDHSSTTFKNKFVLVLEEGE
jgi:hypothetical protein